MHILLCPGVALLNDAARGIDGIVSTGVFPEYVDEVRAVPWLALSRRGYQPRNLLPIPPLLFDWVTITWVVIKTRSHQGFGPVRVRTRNGLTRGRSDMPLDHVLNKRWSYS